ncbi:molybdate ABC transporter substrate-binding protein [Aureibacillus halotolerans]|uniref:Molybdate transport system substrate-binding protein n=1 Tax=Aureibacillus halotolerans TaxID=1508390 RepID=A0A4R6U823_9BACI|nr:molybdate ABC transporter substrate-binding protein [Aureibacillus halotolerans]TDQ40745.1 molybdate transport system substrate-binding protein [Aureibacillus halotolerans]
MNKRRWGCMILIVMLLLTACGQATGSSEGQEVELTISAAASLQDSLEEIKSLYEKEHPNVQLNFNFGGSGALQQQISKGAPVDLFFSAAQDKFEVLEEEGKMSSDHSVELLQNELVLIVPKESELEIESLEDATEVETFAIGTPETVPAGAYAKETFTAMQLWEEIEPYVVFTKDVRQVLQYVETGNAEAGMVYKTDALSSDSVEVAASAPADTHTPIVYPVGVTEDAPNKETAIEFYEFLQTDEALEVFQDDGFTVS